MSEHVPHPHPHQPSNVNMLHKQEKAAASFNQKVAVGMTRLFSSMWTFWLILSWIGVWIISGWFVTNFPDKMPWPMLLALASVPQLPLMVVIMVGQRVLGRHQELQAEEIYRMAQKTCSDNKTLIEQNNQILALLETKPRSRVKRESPLLLRPAAQKEV